MTTTGQLLRLEQVEELVGFKKSFIYKMIAEKKFPKPLVLGTRASRWKDNEIKDWINGDWVQAAIQ
ncbi:MAG: AlpA family phage regulatory protein [Magnetococcales bacterium]|nr:AlpA family phage regulatory protein [Magnetococcales bacterium]